MRFLRSLTALVTVLVTVVVAPMAVADDPTTPAVIEIGKLPVPQGKVGEQVQMVIPLINRSDQPLTGVVVTPKPSADPLHFPFEITSTSFAVQVDQPIAPAGTLPDEQAQVTVDLGSFTLRQGLASGAYGFPVAIQYRTATGYQIIEKQLFVNVEGVAAPEPQTPQPIIQEVTKYIEVPASQNAALPGIGDLPTDTGGLPAANNQASTSSVTPRLMLVSFATNPEIVTAGQDLDLNFSVQNMSSDTRVSNIKITVVSAEASLLPIGGAASVYIDSVGAREVSGQTLRFRALPTLEERPYLLTMQLDYEANGVPATAQETLAVVVRQEARVDVGNIQVSPSTIEVDRDASISFSVRNRGKSQLYNTMVQLKADQAVSAQELFIGNIAPGTASNADLLVHGDRTTNKPIVVQITYEDASGRATTIEREIELSVTEAVEEAPETPNETTTPSLLLSILPYLVILVIALLIIGSVIIRRKRKARKAASLAEQMDALDDEPFMTDGGGVTG